MEYCRKAGTTVIAALIFTLAVVSTGCDAAPAAQMTPELWREDLRYMESKLLTKHAAPFLKTDEATIRGAFAALHERIPSLNDAEVQVEMGRIVAMLQDGHTELWLAREGRGFRNYPFFLYDYDGDIRIRIAAKPFERLLGARVVAVESIPIAEVVAKVDPLIARDNYVEPLLSIPVYMGVPEILFGLGIVGNPDSATFRFERDGETFDIDLPALGADEALTIEWVRAVDEGSRPLWGQDQNRNYWFEYIEESRTMYVKYNRCEDQKGHPSIRKFSKELFKALDERPVDRLVFDLRNNRGGNYNKSQPLIEGVLKRSEELGRGRLFVITGRETFSAGMVTSLLLRQRAGAILVGEPGRSSPNGCENFEWLHLPNSGLRVDYTDRVRMRAEELAGADVLPVDVEVVNSFEDYRNGRDRVLEAVVAYRSE